MRIYKISQSTKCPQEYGYNLCQDRRVAGVNWNETDLQMCKPWSESVVRTFLSLPDDAVVYRTLADMSDLNERLVEEGDADAGGYDWSELQSRRSLPPPAVVTRLKSGRVLINDGNHRIRHWREQGKLYVPAWCYDEMITEWMRESKKEDPTLLEHNKENALSGDEDELV